MELHAPVKLYILCQEPQPTRGTTAPSHLLQHQDRPHQVQPQLPQQLGPAHPSAGRGEEGEVDLQHSDLQVGNTSLA